MLLGHGFSGEVIEFPCSGTVMPNTGVSEDTAKRAAYEEKKLAKPSDLFFNIASIFNESLPLKHGAGQNV